MYPKIKVTSEVASSFVLFSQGDRQDFCRKVFHLKEKLQTRLDVEMGGVKATIWNHYEFDDVVKALCKPLYYRLAVNPYIHSAVKATLLLSILFSITPNGLFGLVAFNLMAIACLMVIGLGIVACAILIFGSVMDGIDTLKEFLKRLHQSD